MIHFHAVVAFFFFSHYVEFSFLLMWNLYLRFNIQTFSLVEHYGVLASLTIFSPLKSLETSYLATKKSKVVVAEVMELSFHSELLHFS